MRLRTTLDDAGNTRAQRRVHASYASLIALLLAQACARCPAPERYATRGLVRARNAAGEQRELAIHHEALAAFKDREGQLAPMSSMTMIFGLAPELKQLPAPGDKLAFEFEVRWDERPSLLITELHKLPDETALSLSSDHH
jgi:hypothetical protein